MPKITVTVTSGAINWEQLKAEILTQYPDAGLQAKEGVNPTIENPSWIIVDHVNADQTTLDNIVSAHDANILTETQSEGSFLDTMQTIVKAYHTNVKNGSDAQTETTVALTASSTVLNSHATQQSIIVNGYWIPARDRNALVSTIGQVFSNLGQVGNELNENVLWMECILQYYTLLRLERNT